MKNPKVNDRDTHHLPPNIICIIIALLTILGCGVICIISWLPQKSSGGQDLAQRQFRTIGRTYISSDNYISLMLDEKTGIQYIVTNKGGIIARLDKDSNYYYENFEETTQTDLEEK